MRTQASQNVQPQEALVLYGIPYIFLNWLFLDSYYLPGSEDLNTFSTENSARHSLNPAENSKAYQPYRFGKKSGYQSQDDSSGSEDETLRLKASAEQPLASDEDLSSEPGYARPEDVKGSRTRDDVGTRTKPKPNSNDVYAQVKKGNKNYSGTNGRKQIDFLLSFIVLYCIVLLF